MRTNGYRIAKKENRDALVQGLGWFSIGLGLAEVLMPRGLSRLIGVKPQPTLMRLLGVREIISGVGILTQPNKAAWMKSRVVGDAMDLTLLGAAMTSDESNNAQLALATAAVASVTALDVLACKDLAEGSGRQENLGTQSLGPRKSRGVVHFKRSLIINRPREELYRLWHDFEQLPTIMSHVISVRVENDRRSHWVAKGPAGSQVEWDAEVIEDRPNEIITWRSLENADVESFGSVRFERATGGRGTLVRIELKYRPPAGKFGAMIAKLFGQSPEKQIAVDLLRFKQRIETGEIARTEGQPAGRMKSTSRKYDDLVRA
jgi:uncharacterized membrane protein